MAAVALFWLRLNKKWDDSRGYEFCGYDFRGYDFRGWIRRENRTREIRTRENRPTFQNGVRTLRVAVDFRRAFSLITSSFVIKSLSNLMDLFATIFSIVS